MQKGPQNYPRMTMYKLDDTMPCQCCQRSRDRMHDSSFLAAEQFALVKLRYYM